MSDSSSVTMPHSIRNDPRLFKDDVDIRFSRTLNSCKLPQIRYASPERLFERLTDLRFLSIDFLNTFLLTYRVFTDGVTVLEALKKVHYNPDSQIYSMSALHDSTGSLDEIHTKNEGQTQLSNAAGDLLCTVDYDYSRRVSTGSMMSDIDLHRESVVSNSESTAGQQLQQAQQQLNRNNQHWRLSYRKFEEEQARERYLKRIGDRTNVHGSTFSTMSIEMPSGILLSPSGLEPISVPVPPPPSPEVPHSGVTLGSLQDLEVPEGSSGSSSSTSENEQNDFEEATENLQVPVHSQSCDTLTADQSYPNSPLSSATSSATLIGSDSKNSSPKISPIRKNAPIKLPAMDSLNLTNHTDSTPPSTPPATRNKQQQQQQPQQFQQQTVPSTPPIYSAASSFVLPSKTPPTTNKSSFARLSAASATTMNYLKVKGAGGKRGSGSDTESMVSSSITPRSSFQTDTTGISTPRSSFQHPDSPQMSSKAGVVVTSSRASTRRSSTASAASAFAVATAASSNPIEPGAQSLPQSNRNSRHPSAVGSDLKIPNSNRAKRESMISTAATMRVLNVLRHWVSKHSQDFENDPKLLQITTEFLEELVHNTNLLPAEHKAAVQLLQMISKQTLERKEKVDLDVLLSPPVKPSKDNIETLSALEIAECMTYLDHKIFISIQSEEFLGQAWMKDSKTTKAFHILLMTRHFNDISRLVASEIMRASEMQKRISIIEKWAAVADICRCLHNFNGVLQICAAFTNSSVFRLKRTWEKVAKTTKQTIDKLQVLVSTDGRFRNMREALHRCDPPCIPYLGMYLTDLSFIEEGTPNFTEEGLLNFSKMRMIAHVIREIRHFQQTPYKIEHNPKVTNYLLDTSRHLSDDELYQLSLCLEPRLSRLGTKISTVSSGSYGGGSSPSHHYPSAT